MKSPYQSTLKNYTNPKALYGIQHTVYTAFMPEVTWGLPSGTAELAWAQSQAQGSVMT